MKSLIYCLSLLVLECGLLGQVIQPASATAVLYNGFVVGVTVNDGGSGYPFPPVVTFAGGGGSGAGAYSVISNGVVTSVVVTNAGTGYTSPPAVVFAGLGDFSFSSQNAYIQVPTSPSLESTTNQLTVECWFYRTSSQPDWNALVSKDTTGYNSYTWQLRFALNQPVGTFHTAPPTSAVNVFCNPNPTYPAWHHYALQLDGTNFTMWMDGRRLAITNAPGKPVAGTYPLSIGCMAQGQYMFAGLIDEVRISSVARYRSGFTPQIRFAPDTNTVALYHFDEGQGGMVHDSSGNGNDGVIYGSSPWSTNVPFLPPVHVNIHKAVYLDFFNLTVGTNYQLQVSTNLNGAWQNFGSPFTATNPVMTFSNYWNVEDWGELLFRLQ